MNDNMGMIEQLTTVKDDYAKTLFQQSFNRVQKEAHMIALAHGWWDEPRSVTECLCLIHSEVSEALEAIRHGNPPSDHLPYFSGIEEELADIIIRIMDLAQKGDWNVSGALVAKMAFNEQRPYRHGKAL